MLQLAFEFLPKETYFRDDFILSASNEQAFNTVFSPDIWHNNMCVLTGDNGTGKSHIAHIWAAENDAKIIHAGDLKEDYIASLFSHGAAVVEDIDQLPSKESEIALFHITNKCLQLRDSLLLTSSRPINQLKIGLSDLSSRLSLAVPARINPPDEELLDQIFWKLVADYQIEVPSNLSSFVLMRIERRVPAIKDALNYINKRAYGQKKPPMMAYAREYLQDINQFSQEFED